MQLSLARLAVDNSNIEADSVACRSDRAFDRPIDRPKSAVGPVGQPISKPDHSLPNGIPNLPTDLTVDSLANSNKPQHLGGPISFGFQPSQPSLASGGKQLNQFPTAIIGTSRFLQSLDQPEVIQRPSTPAQSSTLLIMPVLKFQSTCEFKV